MGNESTASAKTPAPLASQSAWARGPPQSSPSPQSSAPSHLYPIPASHSRRPSVLVQGVPIPQGVSIPRKIMGPVRQGSSLNFGSIGDASAPVSSSPTTTPVVRHESVKAFGSLPATAATRSNIMNGKVTIPASGSTTGSSEPSSRPPATVPSISSSTSAAASSLSASPVTTSSNVPASAPNITQSTLSGTWSVHTPSASSGPTFNVAKLFLDNPSAFQPFSDVTSPSLQPSNLPHQPSSAGQHALQPPVQALPLSAHPYTSYGPGLRPSRGAGGSGSPTFPRALPNVTDPPPQPIPGPGGPSVPANPKTPTHPHSPSSAGVPAQQHPMQPTHRPGYYNMEYGSQWYHPTQAPYSMGHAPHAPGPILQGPPHPNIPLSPQTQPPFPSDTPIMAHAVPDSPHTHQPSASFSISPPLPTPSTSITSGGRSLNTITTTSVPMASRTTQDCH
ncbi:hypothetical protein EDC04DRAFT_1686195 [Pisolithus marmoratus]|nr:hypothetical protein EDC04DRAFT_1686195 [Pisolithus marmoratus]